MIASPQFNAGSRPRWTAVPTLAGAAALFLAALAGAVAPTAAEPPRRVVSTNLCTDQLAMMIARPEQIASLSRLARNAELSDMAEAAQAFPINDGHAEELVPLAPDLVLAGIYTARSTVSILRRLGYRVEEFAPPRSFADIRTDILRMGDLLGRPGRAAALVADFDARLAAARGPLAVGALPVAVIYHVGNRAEGRGTLADDVLAMAGWRNLATELGIENSGTLPLELLVMKHPDAVLVGTAEAEWTTPAQPNHAHPVFEALAGKARLAVMPDRWSLCGSLGVIDAVRRMVDERRRVATSEGMVR